MDKGISNLEVRRQNRRSILNLLYKNGGMTVLELVKALELSQPTVFNIVKELAAEGLVQQTDSLESSGGRKPRINRVVVSARYSLGIAVTKNHLRITAVNLGAEVIHQEKHDLLFNDSEEYYAALKGICENVILRCGYPREKLLGIGISLPGIIQSGGEEMTFAPTLGIGTLKLCRFRALFGEPVTIANNAKLAALTELWGEGRGDGAIYLLVGGGVGGAILTGENTFDLNSRSGEFGHMTVVDGGEVCSCGRRGCFEVYVSSGVLARNSSGGLSGFFKELREGDGEKRKIWRDYLRVFALGIDNLHTIFDNEIIIGGEMSEYIKEYEAELRRELEGRRPLTAGTDFLRVGSFGEYDASVGAALMHVSKYLMDS
ncbi:MAG: ROK family transcriptional regulator [Oscillospiraceae bacterium]|jgi:predicted NBD/HSP70 family sugar kinase|nr:ROK family transcriptional regulator [Oscillospiraceae bacterium]